MNLDPAKKVYFMTVPHTGTHSTRHALIEMGIEWKFNHFEKVPEIWIEDLFDDYNIITTYRDPFLVAASWANRIRFNNLRRRRFIGNWTRWNLVVDRAVKVFTMDELKYHANSHNQGDVSGAVLALTEKNWDRYFEIVPRELVEHAYEIAYAAGFKSKYEEALCA